MGDFMGFHGDFLMIQIDLVSYKEDGASSNFQTILRWFFFVKLCFLSLLYQF